MLCQLYHSHLPGYVDSILGWRIVSKIGWSLGESLTTTDTTMNKELQQIVLELFENVPDGIVREIYRAKLIELGVLEDEQND